MPTLIQLLSEIRDTFKLLDEAQKALDVLAEDVEDSFPTRAENAADLAMRIRTAINAIAH